MKFDKILLILDVDETLIYKRDPSVFFTILI